MTNVTKLKVRDTGEEAFRVSGYETRAFEIGGTIWTVEGGENPLDCHIVIDPVFRTITLETPNK